MRIEDLLYFAPNVLFDEVDIAGPAFPSKLQLRIDGYYLKPASDCCSKGQAFAAGVLLLSCIDALARLRFGGGVGVRFRRFVVQEIGGFSRDLAGKFYEDFRNGLIHEARIKNGGQFSLTDVDDVVHVDRLLVINPAYLCHALRASLATWIAELDSDSDKRIEVANKFLADFRFEFGGR